MSANNKNLNPYFCGIVIIVSACVIAAGLYASRPLDNTKAAAVVKSLSSPASPEKPTRKKSTINAKAVALRKFDEYSPKIEETNQAAIGNSEAFTGDLNGDGMTDAVVFFVLHPKDGGNMIVGQGLAVYINQGKDMKVVAGFEPDYPFRVEGIRNGKLHVVRLDHSDGDHPNQPGIETNKSFILNGGKLQESNTFE